MSSVDVVFFDEGTGRVVTDLPMRGAMSAFEIFSEPQDGQESNLRFACLSNA